MSRDEKINFWLGIGVIIFFVVWVVAMVALVFI